MSVTAVIINYQTPDLLQPAVHSFKQRYPGIKLLVVDNGSADYSPAVISEMATRLPEMKTLLLKKNIYHGPAMDLVCREHINTEFVFFLDSDTEVLKGGFLEKMMALFDDESVYGVGEYVTVNKRGFKAEKGVTILQTPYMLLRTAIYRSLPPFVHHGQPTLNNFTEALNRGYRFNNFKISDYIYHKWRGTADKFGYGLGWKGKLDYLLNKLKL